MAEEEYADGKSRREYSKDSLKLLYEVD